MNRLLAVREKLEKEEPVTMADSPILTELQQLNEQIEAIARIQKRTKRRRKK